MIEPTREQVEAALLAFYPSDWTRSVQFDAMKRALIAAVPTKLAALCDRLIAAIEGECDGLAITAEQSSNILAYLQYGEPMVGTQGADARPVAIYQEQDGAGHWIDIPRIRYNMIPNPLWKRIVYTTPTDGDHHE